MPALAAGALAPALRSQPGRDGKVKITKFVIHKSTHRWRDLLFLEVHTDADIVGLGEGSVHTRCDQVEAALRWLEPQMVGQDASGPEEHWDRIYYRLTRARNGVDIVAALSAVDIALWDIEGKRLGVPVSRLLGGPMKRPMRAYYTHWNNMMKRREPADFAERAAETRNRGWTAVKWAVPQAKTEALRLRDIRAVLEAIRKSVGDDLDLGLELWESLTPRSAAEFAKAVAPYRPMFMEEPIARETPAAFAEVAARSPVPIATGEGYQLRFEFKQLLEVKGAAIIQPDVLHCGGITEIRKIAHQAEPYGVEIAPHQCFGPIAHVASLSAMTVCRNFFIHEWEADDDDVYFEMTGGKYPRQKDGAVTPPDGSGLGIHVDFAEFARRFPYKPRAPVAVPSFTYTGGQQEKP